MNRFITFMSAIIVLCSLGGIMLGMSSYPYANLWPVMTIAGTVLGVGLIIYVNTLKS